MLCEICHTHAATVHIKQSVNHIPKEMHICEECAEAHGCEIDLGLSLNDFLFGDGEVTLPPAPAGRRCRTCGFTAGDFNQQSRMGCPACYEVLAAEVLPMLRDIHTGLIHQGKVPASIRRGRRADVLKQSLEQAVAAQDFEQAASLRDRLRALETGAGHDA